MASYRSISAAKFTLLRDSILAVRTSISAHAGPVDICEIINYRQIFLLGLFLFKER